MKDNKCPFCKNTFSDEEILNTVSVEAPRNYRFIHDFDESTYVVNFECPNSECGFKDSAAISGSKSLGLEPDENPQTIGWVKITNNPEIEEDAKSYALHHWKDIINSDVEQDYCPSCGLKATYDEDEFVYPMYIKDTHLDERTVKITCTANHGCGLEYVYQSRYRGKDLYNEALAIWNRIYQ